jgi:4-amino-4-deoxy-L-arabinose transferase-like glycosyltransferase
MINWIKKNKLEFFLLLGVLSIALFLRLYRIGGFLTFLGDEGRDVRIVRDLLQGNLVFIGPQTSVGNMYLGPLYYYMMAPALLLSGLSPVGPAVMIALISVITVLFSWFAARSWFGKQAAAITAILFAISPIAIIYGRTSWNPNPMPFFALLTVWGIYQVWQNKKYLWLPIVGISTAFALQMHYLALLLLPTIGLFWLLTLLKIKKEKLHINKLILGTVVATAIFLCLMSPLVLFDLKHQGMNLHAFTALVSAKSGVFNLGHLISKPYSIFTLSQSLLSGEQGMSLFLTIAPFIITTIFLFIKRKQNPVKLLTAWLLFVILGLSLYNQPVYIHYLGLIYPAVFILTGAIFAFFIKKNIYTKWLSLVLLLGLIVHSFITSPSFGIPNNQLKRTEAVADLIIKESEGKPFNLGLIAKQNYDESYRYFLENKRSALEKDQNKITDQLFVICEDGPSCKPEGHSQYQIAVFGVAHVEKEWQVDYIKIFRLIHTK